MESLYTQLHSVWAILAGAGTVVFGAGIVVEKIRADKYITKDVHTACLKTIDAKFETIQVQLVGMQSSLTKLTDWTDRIRD